MGKEYNENPLILVFYIDRDMVNDYRMMQPFVESVNNIIEEKNANILAFFIPCDDGTERIEAINPVLVEKPEMDKINAMIKDIQKSFSIGAKIDVPDEEIEIKNKECACGNSPSDKCECN